jgi:Ca-activated chloride channel homolog
MVPHAASALAMLLGMAASFGIADAAGADDRQQPIRVGIDLVNFGVVVTDKQGSPVTGLTAADFEVVEEDTPQRVTFFASGDTALAPPLHLGFLLDTSGSMEEDMKDVRTAAVKFLNKNEHAVDVTLVDFDTEVRVSRYGPDDFPRLIERIRMRKPQGYTALYDALGVYLSGAWSLNGQKVLVAYTDGGDTRSSINAGEVSDLLKASDVTLYAIGYLEHQSSTARTTARMELQRFAAMTGGQAFFPTKVTDLDSVYERIQKEVAARYNLGYMSTNDRTDGAWREVRIRLKRPDLKGAKLRTRAGYFAPYKR